MIRNRYSAIDMKHGRVFFIFITLIFINHKLINLLIVIDLFALVFIFSPTSYRRLIDVETTSCFYWAYIFFRLSKVWSMLHHGSVGQVQNKIKNTRIYFQILF